MDPQPQQEEYAGDAQDAQPEGVQALPCFPCPQAGHRLTYVNEVLEEE